MQRGPDVGVGERLVRERAGAGDFDCDVVVLGESDDVVHLRPRFVGGGRLEGLLQADVVDHDLGVGMPPRQLRQDRQLAPAEDVDRDPAARTGIEHMREPGMIGVDALEGQHDARADDSGPRGPGLDLGRDRVGVGVERRDQAEAIGVLLGDALAVAGVVAVDREGRNQQRAVDADGVHRRDHLLAGHRRRTGQHGAVVALVVAVVGVHLAVDRWRVCSHEWPARS